MSYSVYLILAILSLSATADQFPSNPCPSVFSYRQNLTSGFGEYYGEIVLPKDQSVNVFELELNMSVNAEVPDGTNIKIILLSPQQEVFHGQQIKYGVVFPIPSPLCQVTQIKLNNHIYCSGNPDSPQGGGTQTAMWAKTTMKITTKTPPAIGVGPPGGQVPSYPPIVGVFSPTPFPPYYSTYPPVGVGGGEVQYPGQIGGVPPPPPVGGYLPPNTGAGAPGLVWDPVRGVYVDQFGQAIVNGQNPSNVPYPPMPPSPPNTFFPGVVGGGLPDNNGVLVGGAFPAYPGYNFAQAAAVPFSADSASNNNNNNNNSNDN